MPLEKLGVPDNVIGLIRSCHEGAKARVSINGNLLEEKVEGLTQGCTLAPTLFNLYACLVMERWKAWVIDLNGVGTAMLNKLDGKLFRRSSRGAQGV